MIQLEKLDNFDGFESRFEVKIYFFKILFRFLKIYLKVKISIFKMNSLKNERNIEKISASGYFSIGKSMVLSVNQNTF